jgi:hypothetical protein
LVDTLKSADLQVEWHGPGRVSLVDASIDVDDAVDDGGVAEATHGAATNPVPMPAATASAPTRPMQVVIELALLVAFIRIPRFRTRLDMQGGDGSGPARHVGRKGLRA